MQKSSQGASNTSEPTKSASIILVGTYKDKVWSAAEHEVINTLLFKHFRLMEIFVAIEPFKEGNHLDDKGKLYFFPVDNTLGKSDPVILKLQTKFHECVLHPYFLVQKIPFSWLALFYKIQVLKQAKWHFLSLDDFTQICKECEVGGPDKESK